MSKMIFSAILLSASLAVPAFAQDKTPDVRVEYSDLNLTSPAGQRALDRRISKAVDAVCPDDGTADLGSKMAITKCRRLKLASVMPQREAVLARFERSATQLASAR